MTLVTLFCILGVALILGVLSVVFRPSTNLLNFAVNLLAPTTYLLLALISANLASSFGGYTLFISIGLAITIAVEAFKCIKVDSKQSNTLFLGLSNALSLVCFVVAGIVLAKFNILGLACGLLLGLGAGFLVLIFRKMSLVEGIMTVLNIALGGLILGQAIVLLIAHASIIGTVLYFISSILILFELIFSVFVKEDRVMQTISRTASVLGLITLALSIYFMI